jgi:hypothetical protein
MNFNAVEQRTGDPFLVFGHNGVGTAAWLLGVPVESAGAGMYTIGHPFMEEHYKYGC